MSKNIALVLGSGGARGIAHIGAIRELEKQGCNISSISGTSMGALIGGIYASGKLDEFEEWLCEMDRMDVLSKIDFTLSKNGIIKARKFIREIKQFIPDQNIEDLPIPFTSIATDINNKKEMVLSKGNLWDAIRASIAIPMIITPNKVEDIFMVDGGVLNPVPVNHVYRQEDDMLVAINVNALSPKRDFLRQQDDSSETSKASRLKTITKKMNHVLPLSNKDSLGYIQLIQNTTGLMLSQISKLTLELTPPDLLVDISRESCWTFDFHKAKELIVLGEIETRESLEKYRDKLINEGKNRVNSEHSMLESKLI